MKILVVVCSPTTSVPTCIKKRLLSGFCCIAIPHWWNEECSLSTMRIRHFLSQPTFQRTQLVLIWFFSEMRSVPFLQWESAGFCHNQHLKGINFWTYPTGPNMGFQWDEEGLFLFYNETQTFSVTTNVQLVSTFEHTQLVLIWVLSEMRKECSFSTMRLRHFPSQPMFNWYQLLNIPNWC